MCKEQILDALKDALRELEALEEEYEWYSAGAVAEKIEQAIKEVEHDLAISL